MNELRLMLLIRDLGLGSETDKTSMQIRISNTEAYIHAGMQRYALPTEALQKDCSRNRRAKPQSLLERDQPAQCKGIKQCHME